MSAMRVAPSAKFFWLPPYEQLLKKCPGLNANTLLVAMAQKHNTLFQMTRSICIIKGTHIGRYINGPCDSVDPLTRMYPLARLNM